MNIEDHEKISLGESSRFIVVIVVGFRSAFEHFFDGRISHLNLQRFQTELTSLIHIYVYFTHHHTNDRVKQKENPIFKQEPNDISVDSASVVPNEKQTFRR